MSFASWSPGDYHASTALALDHDTMRVGFGGWLSSSPASHVTVVGAVNAVSVVLFFLPGAGSVDNGPPQRLSVIVLFVCPLVPRMLTV